MNILIVEDEEDIRDLLEFHILKEGYNIFKRNLIFMQLF